jgi:hypothetical protein
LKETAGDVSSGGTGVQELMFIEHKLLEVHGRKITLHRPGEIVKAHWADFQLSKRMGTFSGSPEANCDGSPLPSAPFKFFWRHL